MNHFIKHLAGTVPVHIQKSSEFQSLLQCRFSSETRHRSPVHPGALRTVPSPWPEHRTPFWTDAGVGAASIADAGRFCGGRATRGGQRSQHRLATPFCAAQRSLDLRVASCMPAHTAAPPPWPGKHRARPLPPMGPRRPVLPKPPNTPNPTRVRCKTEPVDLHVDDQPPNLPDQALRRRNHRRRSPFSATALDRL